MKYAVEHGMIDLSYVQEQIAMNQRKELLEKHPHKIWEGKDGKWYTYIHYESGERALKKRGTKDEIETLVIQYYQEQEQHPCFREVYAKWILEKEEFCECRWVRRKMQNNNRRNTIRITYNGNAMNLSEIAELEDIPYSKVYSFYRSGKNLEEEIRKLKK